MIRAFGGQRPLHYSAQPALVAGLARWVADLIESLGYPGIAVLIAFEQLFPPVPSELILPFSGFLAAEGRLRLPGVIAAATAGSVAGALMLYAAGARLGEERVRSLVSRFGKFAGIRARDLDRAGTWFDHHGAVAVLAGRLVPVVRSLVSIPAGLRRMSLAIFIASTAVGSAVWNSVLIGSGWMLGDRWHQVERYASVLQYVVVAALALLVGLGIWKRRESRNRREGDR